MPRKNVRLLAGKPLLRSTAESALAARRLSRVILSTEDPEIADVGRRCGLEVPFVRPLELAADSARDCRSSDMHSGGWRSMPVFDALCLFQPTNPLRRPEDIDGCVELLEASGADAVVSMLPVPAEYNPHWVSFRGAEGHLRLSTGEDAPMPRRQELPPPITAKDRCTSLDGMSSCAMTRSTARSVLAILWIPLAA